MKYYAIGDVHGEYETLLRLVEKLPEKTELFFVGDLIDRGADSKKVVDFVRNGNHKCVLGNHEDMMIEEAKRMKKERDDYTISDLWAYNGGLPTLLSYGIIDVKDGGIIYTKNESNMNAFIDDAEWMDTLPLAIYVPVKYGAFNVFVSHACIGRRYDEAIKAKKIDKDYGAIKNYAIWNREQMGSDCILGIFNIFGHTPQENVKKTFLDLYEGGNYLNIDTGCTYDREGFDKLTAVNIETMKIVTEER